MDLMAIAVAEQVFGHDAVLELRRQPPLARHHVVARQVPPEIIVELLCSPIDLPAPEYLEGFAVHDEHAGRTVGAVRARAPERADVDALGAAMDRVGPRVPGLAEVFLRLNHLVQLGLRRMRVGVDDVDARRAQTGDDQEPAPEEGVAREGRKGRAAGIPAEVVELVALVRHHDRVHERAVCA